MDDYLFTRLNKYTIPDPRNPKWRTKGESGKLLPVARNPHLDEQMTPEQIAAYRQKLASMDAFALGNEYKDAYRRAEYRDGGYVPTPSRMQRLIQAWKALRQAKKTGRWY